jgi:hypothetical protein
VPSFVTAQIGQAHHLVELFAFLFPALRATHSLLDVAVLVPVPLRAAFDTAAAPMFFSCTDTAVTAPLAGLVGVFGVSAMDSHDSPPQTIPEQSGSGVGIVANDSCNLRVNSIAVACDKSNETPFVKLAFTCGWDEPGR